MGSMIVTVSREMGMWRVAPISGEIHGGAVLLTSAVILRDVEFIVNGTPDHPWETKRAYVMGEHVWSHGEDPLEMPQNRLWSFFVCEVGGEHVFKDAFRPGPLRRSDMVVLADGYLHNYMRDRWDF